MAELEWLPVVVAAIVGIALMFLLGFAINLIIPVDTSLEGWLTITWGIGIFCYFTTGLIAGAWTNWKGATYGGFAAMVVWFVNLIYSFVIGIAYGLAYGPVFFLGVFIVGLFMMGIGALGGFVGERIRR